MLNIKTELRKCIAQTLVIDLALLPEQHSPQVVNLILTQGNTNCMSISDGDDGDVMGIENCQPGQAFWCLRLCSSDGTERPGSSPTSSPQVKSTWGSSSSTTARRSLQ